MTERAASAADATRLDVGARTLNPCTMVVSACDVFDALRSQRVYRAGLTTDRIKHIMGQQDSTAFNGTQLLGGGDADPSGRSVPAAGLNYSRTARVRN